MKIIPGINGSYCQTKGSCVFPAEFALPADFPRTNEVFAQRLRRLGNYRITADAAAAVTFERMETGKEAYRMAVSEEGVRVEAAGEKGYSNALTTLYQMLAQGSGEISCCEIEDAPRYEYRGFMLDVCRHFFSAEEVKRIIEQAALLKLNAFHWHLSNDQGYRIESERFPELNRISSYRKLSPQDEVVLAGKAAAGDQYGGYYTKQEIRDVVAYAAARGIEVIPELEMPGHSSAILAAFPQYTCSGEPLKVKNTFGIHERIFCAGKEEGFAFLYELLDEICELFPSPHIHLGGDEAPKTVWHSCPACNRVMKQMGYTSYESLQTYFSAKLIHYAEKNGKTPIVWNESAISGDLDEHAVIQYWAEMAPTKESYITPELAKGRKIIFSDSNYLYSAATYAERPMRTTLVYEPQLKGTPVPKENILGTELCLWTEWTADEACLEPQYMPRMLAVAENAWTEKRDVSEFEERAKAYMRKEALVTLAAASEKDAWIGGEEALRLIAKGLLQMGAKYRSMTTGDDEEESGKVEAVVPDGAEQMNPLEYVHTFVSDSMKAAYTEEEIDKVVGMVLEVMKGLF